MISRSRRLRRFRSTIEFPAFLLHVLKVWRGDDSADEGGLDDKKLIERFDTDGDGQLSDAERDAIRMSMGLRYPIDGEWSI